MIDEKQSSHKNSKEQIKVLALAKIQLEDDFLHRCSDLHDIASALEELRNTKFSGMIQSRIHDFLK